MPRKMLPNIKMQKFMMEFLRKFENRGIKIALIKLYGVGGPL